MSRSYKKAPKLEKKRTARVWLLGFLGFGVVVVVVGLLFLVSKSKPWGLPAVPRNQRPATLSPDLFTGQVREAYRIAQEVPELLERMPCYCGCYVKPGHRNNLDCYTDRHGAG